MQFHSRTRIERVIRDAQRTEFDLMNWDELKALDPSLITLTETYTEANGWRLHYVTARELVNILHAAEDGHCGNAGHFRDYRYKLPG